MLRLFSDYINISVASCNISNPFHKSVNGCSMLITSHGEVKHCFNKLNYSKNHNGTAICNLLETSNHVTAKVKLNEDRCKVTTLCTTNFVGLEEILKTEKEFLIILDEIARNGDLVAGLVTNTLYTLYLKPKYIFDVYFIRKGDTLEINYFRPVIYYEKMNRNYYAEYRECFFYFLEMFYKYSLSLRSDEDEPPKKMKTMKDATRCSAKTFTKRPPPELKCPKYSDNICPHISENIGQGRVTVLKRPVFMCYRLLEQMINDHTEAEVNSFYNFRCYFCRTDLNRNDTFNLGSNFNSIYKRCTTLHRLCLPKDFINDKWFAWFRDNFIFCNKFTMKKPKEDDGIDSDDE